MYKKINNYILENHPLLWHSRSIQLTVVASLFSVLAYFSAYFLIDMESLSDSISNYYFKSNFVFFHAIFGVVVLALWAAYFFKNNALKSFYPLSRFYLQKLMLLLFIPFLILVSVYIPFTKGAQAKTMYLLHENELKKDIEIVNLASAFLPIDEEQYKLDQRVFPAPFPLESIEFNSINKTWNKTLFYNPEIKKNALVLNLESDEYEPIPSNSTWVNGVEYQFYKSKKVYTTVDSCVNQDVVSAFYVFDSSRFQLAENSILNYSQLVLDEEPYLNEKLEQRDYDRYNSYYPSYGEIYRKKYAARVHQLVQEQNWEKIEQILVDFESVLNKYAIRSVLSPSLITAYIKEKKVENLRQIINPYLDSRDYFEHRQAILNLDQFLSNYSKESLVPDLENELLFSFDNSGLSTVFSNFSSSKNDRWTNDLIVGFLFFALILVCIVLLFEFIPPISFLLSVPISGVLLILVGLIVTFYLMTNRNHGNDIFPIMMFLVLILSIQILNLIAIKSNLFKRAVGNILMSLSYLSIPFLLPLLYVLVDGITKKTIELPCGNTKYVTFLDSILLEPSSIFGSVFMSVFVFLFLVRKWKAKAEN